MTVLCHSHSSPHQQCGDLLQQHRVVPLKGLEDVVVAAPGAQAVAGGEPVAAARLAARVDGKGWGMRGGVGEGIGEVWAEWAGG